MKKLVIAAAAGALLIAGQTAASASSSEAGPMDSAPRVPDRLAPSYNASLNVATTQSCTVNKLFRGTLKSSTTNDSFGGQQQECDESVNKTQRMLATLGIGFAFVAIYAIADDSDSD